MSDGISSIGAAGVNTIGNLAVVGIAANMANGMVKNMNGFSKRGKFNRSGFSRTKGVGAKHKSKSHSLLGL